MARANKHELSHFSGSQANDSQHLLFLVLVWYWFHNVFFISQISEKQYLLTALGARAKLKQWFDVDALFTSKNWLGYTKKKSPVGFHRVVDILQKNNAPVSVGHLLL